MQPQAFKPGVYMGPPTTDLDRLKRILEQAGFQVFQLNGMAVGGLEDFMNEAIKVLGFPQESGDCYDAMQDRIADMPWIPPGKSGDIILWNNSYHSYHANPGDFLKVVREFQDYSQHFLNRPGYRVPGYKMYVLLLGEFPATLREVPNPIALSDLEDFISDNSSREGSDD